MTSPFDFDIEISDSVETAVQDAVKAIEEQEPIVPETPETETPEVTEDDFDPTGYSEAARYALSLQKIDGLLPEDFEIPKDLKPEKLKELLWEAAQKKANEEDETKSQAREEAERQRLAEKGLTDQHLTYIQQIINGADPQIVSRVAQYRSWAEAELEDEEEMESAIRAGLRIQLSNNPNADDLIESYIDTKVKGKGTEVLQAESQKFQDYIGQVADYLEVEDGKRLKAEADRIETEERQYASDLEKQLQTGFLGLELKKAEQKKLHEYMTVKSETIEINTPNGKKKVKVTKEEFDKRKDAADLAKRAFEAHQRMTGFTKLVNTAVSTAQDKFLRETRVAPEKQKQVNVPQLRSNGDSDFEITI